MTDFMFQYYNLELLLSVSGTHDCVDLERALVSYSSLNSERTLRFGVYHHLNYALSTGRDNSPPHI